MKYSLTNEPETTGPDAAPQRSRPSGEAVLEELARILASKTFQAADGQRSFLRYAVERTIAGETQFVKEYTIGVEVFKRGTAFDPRLDNIVRAEARKLRVRLAKYYEKEGTADPVRIEFPKRGYVPIFSDGNGREVGVSGVAQSTGPVQENTHQTSELRTLELRLPRPAHSIARLSGVVLVVTLILGVVFYAFAEEWHSKHLMTDTASIVVLPFHNLGDVKDESFTDGLTEDLITSLGRVKGLHVAGRTSAFQFRNTTLGIREIGARLNVRTVLEGSVRIYGNRLRVTAELEDSSNGYHIWSDSYDTDFRDALVLQRDISQAIVMALGNSLARGGSQGQLTFSPARTNRVNAEAYQDYVRGVYFWNKQTAESISTAIDYFQQAIARDPNYAPAYTGLARCYVNMPAFTMTRARDVLPKIRELAMKALDLDDSLPEPHLDLAYVAFVSYDWPEAEEEFKKGLALEPGDPVAHRWYGLYLANAGRLNDALKEVEISQRLDPVSPYVLDGLARNLYLMRRYDEAIEQFKRTFALEWRHGYAHLGLGMTYLQIRNYPEAIRELKIAEEQLTDSPAPLAGLAAAYVRSGRPEEARGILRGFLDQASRGSFPPKPIADVYASLGEKDKAFEWLSKAIDAHDVNLHLKVDPFYDPLRSDPRFGRLLRRARLTVL